jgi:hypothetical protein
MGACPPQARRERSRKPTSQAGPTRTPPRPRCDPPARRRCQWNDQQERLIDALLTVASSERGIERWEPFDLADIAGKVTCGKFRTCCTQQEQNPEQGQYLEEACVAACYLALATLSVKDLADFAEYDGLALIWQ